MTKRTALCSRVGFLALALLWLSGPAWAQSVGTGDDPLLVLPDVFLIIDTSGSMASGSYPCGGGAYVGTCTRQYATREVLTGTFLNWARTCGGPTHQLENGILDIYKELVRFGVSTFDDDRSCGCGTCRGANTWNYPDWGLGDSRADADGNPNGRMGIKGRTAPAGALVDLVLPGAPDDLLGNNVRVQNTACTAAADVCTPLNATLWDARYYYTNWQSEISPPYSDPYGSCRPRFVILFTDGQNNGPASYGYQSPEMEAFALFSMGIPVFVVGFGNVRPWTDPIALWGSGGLVPSFVADNPAELFLAFSAVLDAILSGSASRTEMSSVASSASFGTSYNFAAYFEITVSGLGWKGYLMRIPITLDVNGQPVWSPQSDWTFYHEELAAMPAGSRKLYTVVNDPRSKTFSASQLPRPVSNDPLVGLYPFEAGRTEIDDWMCLQASEGLSVPQLGDRVRDFVRGVPGTPSYANKLIMSGPLLGDIFHSDPVVVPPPSGLTPDFRYEAFFRSFVSRHTMLYVGANDGMLHAFVAEDHDGVAPDLSGQELWGFVPTNLLAKLKNLRLRHDFFVDGTPVVRDVFFSEAPLQVRDPNTGTLNDLVGDAGTPILGSYRTVLISGQRTGGGAYFALDVTDPENPGYLWEYRPDIDVSADYFASRCAGPKAFSFAEPVIGQVWLKNANPAPGQDPFLARSVMMVPGGYVSPAALMNVNNCIDFVEGLMASNSVHVVDIQTGKLLKKFIFSNAVPSHNQTKLDNYYDQLANMPNNPWNVYGVGARFSGAGWHCGEKRKEIDEINFIPEELLNHCTVEDTETLYRKQCCWNPGTSSDSCAGLTTCHYIYEKKKNVPGGLYVFLKLEGCGLPGVDQNFGRFDFRLEDDFSLESVAGTPVAYNTNVGEYITRVYFPTTAGRVYRVDFGTAKYNAAGNEAERVLEANMLIQKNDDFGNTYRWDVGRLGGDPSAAPDPWFDMQRDDGRVPRPIMVAPTLAMNYERELMLFFGTGETDTLEYRTASEYFYGVREALEYDAIDKVLKPKARGELDTNMRVDFRLGERMWGKPIVAGGDVYFTSYRANPNRCVEGSGAFYGLSMGDLQEAAIPGGRIDFPGSTPSAKVVWSPAGAQVVIQTGTTILTVDVAGVQPVAQMMHWGRVL